MATGQMASNLPSRNACVVQIDGHLDMAGEQCEAITHLQWQGKEVHEVLSSSLEEGHPQKEAAIHLRSERSDEFLGWERRIQYVLSVFPCSRF